MPGLWTFDLAARTGFARGAAGRRPDEVGVRIFHRPGQPPETAAAELGCFLRDELARGPRPALIGVERYLSPEAQMHAAQTKISQQMRGALEAVASCYRVPVLDAEVSAVRVHFCGVSSAHKRTRRPAGLRGLTLPQAIAQEMLPPGSTREDLAAALKAEERAHARRREESRDATKDMVIARAVALGYLPRGCDDGDRADACALFDYFSVREFNARPNLTLTGAQH